MLNLVLIGCGYWGRILLKNLLMFRNVIGKIYIVSQSGYEDLDKYMVKNPIFTHYESIEELLSSSKEKEFDGIIISNHPVARLEAIKKIIGYTKNIFCEKPVALSYAETVEIFKIIEDACCNIIVDYVYLYLNEFQILKKKCKLNNAFKIKFISGNYGPFRNYSVLWDYLPHDLSMLFSLVTDDPVNIDVRPIKSLKNDGEAYYIKVKFKGGLAKIDLSNQRNRKKRLIYIKSNNVWKIDDTYSSGKLSCNNNHLNIANSTPLFNILTKFIDYCFSGKIHSENNANERKLSINIAKTIHQIEGRLSATALEKKITIY